MKGNDEWKTKDKRYLKELQKMLDIVENVKDEELKNRILNQFVRHDELITELAIKHISK